MPDVVGKQLDVAQSDVEQAGYDDDIEVVGGGTFGVIVESNWTVCSQEPASGEEITDDARFTVARTCEDDEAEDGETAAEPEGETPEGDEAEDGEAAAEPEGEAPEDDDSTEGTADSEEDAALTVKNSADLKALLAAPDYCSAVVASFAKKHGGATIEFDGSIAAMANHGDYDTRYDILVAPGDKGSMSTIGPAFQFRDVNMFDLNFTGSNTPDYIGADDKVRVVAEVGQYNRTSCLLQLIPVSTRVR